MSVYTITYFVTDTCGCGHDHDHDHEHHHEHDHEHEHMESSEGSIIGKIKSLGAWANFMPEGYLVKSTLSAQEILEELTSVANKGDIIFVTKADAESSACTHQAVVEWISR